MWNIAQLGHHAIHSSKEETLSDFCGRRLGGAWRLRVQINTQAHAACMANGQSAMAVKGNWRLKVSTKKQPMGPILQGSAQQQQKQRKHVLYGKHASQRTGCRQGFCKISLTSPEFMNHARVAVAKKRRRERGAGAIWSGCNVCIRLQPRLLPTAFTGFCPLIPPSVRRPPAPSMCFMFDVRTLSLGSAVSY